MGNKHTAEAETSFFAGKFEHGDSRKYWKVNSKPLQFNSHLYKPGCIEGSTQFFSNGVKLVKLFDAQNGLHVSTVDMHTGEILQPKIEGHEGNSGF